MPGTESESAIYRVRRVRVSKSDGQLYDYCDRITAAANNLSNAVRFRQRQVITAVKKDPDALSTNEKEVLAELQLVSFVPTEKRYRLSYYLLNSLMRKTGNPDYFCSDLSKQAAQQTIRQCVQDIDNYWKNLRKYKKSPEEFTGCPQLPGYHKKGGHCTAIITNEDAVVKSWDDGCMKLPRTKIKPAFGTIDQSWRLKEVKIEPDNGTYLILATFEIPDAIPQESRSHTRIAGIDFGVDNLMAVTNNCGAPCLLFKGGIAKSANRLYNKKVAALVSAQTSLTGRKYVPDDMYRKVTLKRNDRLYDFMHKNAKLLVNWCVENRIDTIVFGDNAFWKQEINIGHVNNQNFVQMPFDFLKKTIRYIAQSKGICVVSQEESYTSKASFPDRDPIPVYTAGDDKEYSFSGKRRPTRYKGQYKSDGFRGLYTAGNGEIINSDLNGSANIIRKAFPDAFKEFSVCFNTVIVIRNPDVPADTAKKIPECTKRISHSRQKRMARKQSA